MENSTIVLAQASGEAEHPEIEVDLPDEFDPAAAHEAETHEGTEADSEEHGTFPPFDPATFGSQILWLAITFGLLYYLMSKVALPRIGTILEERNDRIADDLAEAEGLKRQTDEAIAAYEQALAEARKTAHGIAEAARDGARSELDAERRKVEAALEDRLKKAEAEIGKVRDAALSEVDGIARETAAALVETLSGKAATDKAVAAAVGNAVTGGK